MPRMSGVQSEARPINSVKCQAAGRVILSSPIQYEVPAKATSAISSQKTSVAFNVARTVSAS